MKFIHIAVAAGAAAAIATGGAGAASDLPLVKDGTLTIATFGTAYPTIIVYRNGTIGGTSGAWFKAFAKEHNLKIKLFQTTFTSAILAVQQGKADVTMDIYWTPERSKTLYYTYPFSVEGLQVFTKKAFAYNGPASLKGKKIAAVSGVVWTPTLKKFFGSDLQEYPSQAQAGRAFLNGQADAYFEADIQYFAPPINKSKSVVPHDIKPGQYGIAGSLVKGYGYNIVNCKAKGLARALNATLTRLEKNGQWARALKTAGAPAGTLAAQIPPRKSPRQGC